MSLYLGGEKLQVVIGGVVYVCRMPDSAIEAELLEGGILYIKNAKAILNNDGVLELE